MQGRQSAQSERWDEAITRYSSAIEIDPELAEAYSGRGHAQLQKKNIAEAHKDFAKAVKLESFSSEAITGLGICLVQEGNLDGGIQLIEKSRDSMNEDYIYTYNAACVYGRALERAAQAAAHARARPTGRPVSRQVDCRLAAVGQAGVSGYRLDEEGFRPGLAA